MCIPEPPVIKSLQPKNLKPAIKKYDEYVLKFEVYQRGRGVRMVRWDGDSEALATAGRLRVHGEPPQEPTRATLQREKI